MGPHPALPWQWRGQTCPLARPQLLCYPLVPILQGKASSADRLPYYPVPQPEALAGAGCLVHLAQQCACLGLLGGLYTTACPGSKL